MGDIAINVESVIKKYKIAARREKYQTLRDTLTEGVKAPFRSVRTLFRGRSDVSAADSTMWALKDISLTVKHGEAVGIIGHNGAGKSTLLKILSRITEPTHGRMRIRGRVGCLLEVGTGFHPELTGRENIYLNGAILGMRKSEIDRRFDEIVAFAETEKFLEVPVKHYSSGMHVRLAFAVAAHLDPEILVIDEVLAVGDASFQKKCLGKMGDVASSGRTVLFVSHNLAAVTAFCTKGFLLSNGRLISEGPVGDVIGRYVETLLDFSTIPLAKRTDRQGDGSIRFTDATFLDEQGGVTSVAVSGKPLTVRLSYVTRDGRPARNVDMDIAFYGSFGQLLFFCKVQMAHGNFETIPAAGQIACHIPKFPLNPGRYRFKLWCESNRITADRLEGAGTLLVEAGDFYGSGQLATRHPEGVVLVDHQWSVVGNGQPVAKGRGGREMSAIVVTP